MSVPAFKSPLCPILCGTKCKPQTLACGAPCGLTSVITFSILLPLLIKPQPYWPFSWSLKMQILFPPHPRASALLIPLPEMCGKALHKDPNLRLSTQRNDQDPERNLHNITSIWAPSKVGRSQNSSPACWINSAWAPKACFEICPGKVNGSIITLPRQKQHGAHQSGPEKTISL